MINIGIKNTLHVIRKKLYRVVYKKFGVGLKKELRKLGDVMPLEYTPNCDEVADDIFLYWWKGEDFINLGDYLSSVVVNFLGSSRISEREEPVTLCAVGSVIGFNIHKAVVWGSGFLDDSDRLEARAKLSELDVRAVRGPKTYKKLRRLGIKCPKIYGDPAILMPMIYVPKNTGKKYEVAIIPHYAQPLDIPDDISDVQILSTLTTDYEKFIDTIVQSKKIISGSLHGIILAEAYGIPAVLVKRGGDCFKYKDYYYGTGRRKVVVAHSVEEAMKITPMPLPDLEKQRKQLIEAFPNDLWE